MCGRTCMTLQPNEICRACKYNPPSKPDKSPKKESKKQLVLEWRNEYNCGKAYQPTYNMAPQDICPVLVSAKHFDPEKSSDDMVVVPMLWSLIPVWHKGLYNKHGLTTNNCRLEHLPTSKLYAPVLRKGQRCVMLVEGFYEWQTTKKLPSSARAAYYIYMPQREGVKIEDKTTWSPEDVDLLKVAGLYDVWTDADGNLMYSFTVITFESDQKLDWLHHRSPAILETQQQVADWLDYETVPAEAALKVLKQPKQIVWHRVCNVVNNSKNKVPECNKPIQEVKEEKLRSPKSKMMQAWITKKPPVPERGETAQTSKAEDEEVKKIGKRSPPNDRSPKRVKTSKSDDDN